MKLFEEQEAREAEEERARLEKQKLEEEKKLTEEKAKQESQRAPDFVATILQTTPRRNLMTSYSSGSGERPLVTDSSAQKVVKKWGWLHIKYLKKKDKIRRLKTQLKKKTDLLVDLI